MEFRLRERGESNREETEGKTPGKIRGEEPEG
jgi:hypothetical protein